MCFFDSTYRFLKANFGPTSFTSQITHVSKHVYNVYNKTEWGLFSKVAALHERP